MNTQEIIDALIDRSASSKFPDSLCEQAAAEIARLRSASRLTPQERSAVEGAANALWVYSSTRDALNGLLERMK